METVIIALGGNAILQRGQTGTIDEQLRNVEVTCEGIADIIQNGYDVVITHGNGPQVGNILIQNEAGRDRVPAMPLDVCGAQTQGFIGYMIQSSLRNALVRRSIKRSIVTLVSQVLVDKKDQAFDNPSKPVGPFYSEEQANELMARTSETWINDAGRGWRKVVPSPMPIKVVEADTARHLLQHGWIVIASGGGGIPVVESNGRLHGVEAVIDKDLAAARLALQLDADMLLILTDVDKVCINYTKPNEQKLDSMTIAQAEKFLSEGHFSKGSMGPKVRAAMMMASQGRKAVIAPLSRAFDAILGNAGTVVVPD